MFFFSNRRRHTSCALVTGVQTCALPILRAMREPARMQRNHARMDVVTRKEIPSVIENHFVEVVVVVEERHFDRARISLERTRHERSEEHTSELQSLMRKSYAVF